jgi:RimJ/RimL family protein N-acetyltransferase
MKFKELVKKQFDHCKNSNEAPLVLEIYDNEREPVGFLKPIRQNFRHEMPFVAELMSKWRIENPSISTGDFVVTTERTELWLDELVINREDRLIFLIVDNDMRPLGHIGLTNADEEKKTIDLDSVLRGVKARYPGIMAFSTLAIMNWAFVSLKPANIELEVFSDNESAIDFYKRLDFSISEETPLVKISMDNEEKFEPAPPEFGGEAEKYYYRMSYRGNHFNVN